MQPDDGIISSERTRVPFSLFPCQDIVCLSGETFIVAGLNDTILRKFEMDSFENCRGTTRYTAKLGGIVLVAAHTTLALGLKASPSSRSESAREGKLAQTKRQRANRIMAYTQVDRE
jgi:hypothetical protein